MKVPILLHLLLFITFINHLIYVRLCKNVGCCAKLVENIVFIFNRNSVYYYFEIEKGIN